MIQLNLLPDVKTKYIKAQRTKRTVILSTFVISGVAIGVVLLLASVVYGAQSLRLKSLDSDIKDKTAELKKIDGLDKILTIQNQLTALPGLHSDKPVVSRIFVFLPQVTPTDVKIATYDLKLDDSTMAFTGTAKDLVAVNKFVDTLKFTKFTTDTDQNNINAFSSVVLSTFSRTDKEATYSVTLKYNTALFSAANKSVTLVVPKITSTRSETERPTDLFNAQPTLPTGSTN
jgi:Tfp pilus assembly protein PilN